MTAWKRDYDEFIGKARQVPGGHLAIAEFDTTIHYKHGRVSGILVEPALDGALAAGLPVVDTRPIEFGVRAALVIRGPMIALGEPADLRPWDSLSYAPIGDVATALRAAGAITHRIEADPETRLFFERNAHMPLAAQVGAWLAFIGQPVLEQQT